MKKIIQKRIIDVPRISWTNASAFAALLLLLYPSLALLHRSGASATLHSFSLLGLLGVLYVAVTKQRNRLRTFWQTYGLLCIVMLAPLIVNLISKGYAGVYDDIFSTTVQRAAFTGFALFALTSCSRRSLACFQWGVLLALPLAVFILFQLSAAGLVRPDPEPQNLLNYTNFIVLLGMYSLYMLDWKLSRLAMTEVLVKILVFCGAVYAVFLSDSRGSLLSMGILLTLYFVFRVRWCRLRWRLGLCAMVVLTLAILTLQSETMMVRIQDSMETMRESVPAMIQGEQPEGGDASSRIRLGLWYASWEMFKEHPWIGDGSQSFAERLQGLYQQGVVNDEVALKSFGEEAFVQPHNEIANALATRGMAGLIAVLLLYFVPLGYLLRQRRQTDDFGRVAADMGVLTCIAVMLFGLTVTIFTSGWMMAHYVILISLFLALSRPVGESPGGKVKQITFPRPWQQVFLRRVYRTVRGRSQRHNSRLWPYIQLTRNKAGAVHQLSICGYRVPLVTVQEAFAGRGEALHIVLSGPSVGEIDYARLPRLQAMGVNGSLLLQDKVAIDFPLYCLIDRSFVLNKPQIVQRIVDSDRIVFLPVDVLRYIFQVVPLAAIRCRFCIVENICEPAYQRGVRLQDLRDWQSQGAKIALFSDQEVQGFSFDETLGWFDADTVAYAALQIAVWGGMKQLVFHGLDLTVQGTTSRFYDEGAQSLISRLDKRFAAVIEPSFRQTMPLLAQRGIQVFNLSPHSALGSDIIPFLDWKTFCNDAT